MKLTKKQQLNQLLIIASIFFCVTVAILVSVMIKYKSKPVAVDTYGNSYQTALPAEDVNQGVQEVQPEDGEKDYKSTKSAKKSNSKQNKKTTTKQKQTEAPDTAYEPNVGDLGTKISDESLTNADVIININQATKEELTRINGIDALMAERIIAYRNANGYFSTIDELLNVEGITQDVLNSIYEYLIL